MVFVWIKAKRHIVCSKSVTFELENHDKSLAIVPVETKERSEVQKQASIARAHESLEEVDTESDEEVGISTETTSKRTLRDRGKLKHPSRLIEMLLTEVHEPKSYTEAIESTDKLLWQSAMEEEMNSLEDNSTWTLVNLSPNYKPILNRWVY